MNQTDKPFSILEEMGLNSTEKKIESFSDVFENFLDNNVGEDGVDLEQIPWLEARDPLTLILEAEREDLYMYGRSRRFDPTPPVKE